MRSLFRISSAAKFDTMFRPSFLLWNVVSVLVCTFLSLTVQHIAVYSLQSAAADSVVPSVSSNLPQAPGVIQTCVPADNSEPLPLDLTQDTDGLKQQIDTPTEYQIFGSTPADLRDQIRQCAPKTDSSAVFTAQTMYQMGWQYRLANDGNGMCHVEHAVVGIHVSQTLPRWQSTTQSPAVKNKSKTDLGSAWTAFMSSLTTHEAGHVALDVQHAQTLLNDITHFPPTACSQITQSINYLADSDVAALAQANDNYDSSTDHGASQGAILPQ